MIDCNEDFDVVSSGLLLALPSDADDGFISLEDGVNAWDISIQNDGMIGRILLARFCYIL